MKLSLGYPGAADEIAMVMGRQGRDPLQELGQLLTTRDLIAMQEEVAATFIGEPVVQYIVALIGATRNSDLIDRGASPRATLSVTSMAKAVARLRGRDYVVPKDVQEVFTLTVAHRLILSNQAEGKNLTAEMVLEDIITQVPTPRLH